MIDSTGYVWDGSLHLFACVDGAGRAQVVWNVWPDHYHKEVMDPFRPFDRQKGIEPGLILAATLDGAQPGRPREVFMSPLLPVPGGGVSCDGFGVMSGYADAAGQPHVLASLIPHDHSARPLGHPVAVLVEGGKRKPGFDGPASAEVVAGTFATTLLVDAKGRQHAIWVNPSGERPSVRDTLLGADDDPTVIRAAAGPTGQANDAQAFQGPGGTMVVFMQFRDDGPGGDADTFVSTSTGGPWSKPVNITNNATRKTLVAKKTGPGATGLTLKNESRPGLVAAAVDRDGHLVLAMVGVEDSLFSSQFLGLNLADGKTRPRSSTPTVRFLRL
jgi:hypothetical protein